MDRAFGGCQSKKSHDHPGNLTVFRLLAVQFLAHFCSLLLLLQKDVSFDLEFDIFNSDSPP